MNFVTPDFTPALPELFLLSAVCLILVVDVFLEDGRRHLTYLMSQLALLATALLTLGALGSDAQVTFDGHYIRDGLSDLLKLCTYVTVAGVFLYTRDYLRERGLMRGEFYTLALFGTLGMMVMISAHSLLTVYLGLELLSLSLYALVALDRDSPVAAEAAMKYFVLGALASGMLLYGVSMLYGATGTIDLAGIAQAISSTGTSDPIFAFGLAFTVVGLAFKLGVVPFHMWVPDVYQGSPTAVTLYLGSAPKLAAFALVMRVLTDGLAGMVADWQMMLAVMAALSIAGGNLIAIAQTNIKRMLAYSTISHVGFLLLGVLAGTEAGYGASLFYAITYVLMVAGAFGIILILSRNGFEAENISDFKGLNERSPWLAFLMLMVMMSTAGVPPLVGFYAKLVVLKAVIDVGMLWLALLAVLFSVVGAFYYLRVIKFMYFDRPERSEPVVAPGMDTQIAISANGLAVLALGLYPAGLMGLCLAAIG